MFAKDIRRFGIYFTLLPISAACDHIFLPRSLCCAGCSFLKLSCWVRYESWHAYDGIHVMLSDIVDDVDFAPVGDGRLDDVIAIVAPKEQFKYRGVVYCKFMRLGKTAHRWSSCSRMASGGSWHSASQIISKYFWCWVHLHVHCNVLNICFHRHD